MNYVYLIKSISFVLYEWHHNALNIFFTFGGKKFQWKQIVAELAGIFVECSFKFISRLKAYDKISKKNWYLAQGLRLCLKVYVDSL